LLLAASCPPPEPPDPGDELVKRGETLFFEETFDGNGRTCGTCHPRENNFTLDSAFIATLPNDDPLFVAETNPDLAENFENPRLMRELGLILENLDGFGDLANVFVMRGIPRTLALKTSIASGAGPRTGWSGDGAPGDGSLRSFATGAVIQHFTKTTNRVAGVDFRLPTEEELDALEAFQLSLGRQEDLALPIALEGDAAARGQEIFLDRTLGKCSLCHFNAGANGDPAVFGPQAGNLSFDTGVEVLPDQPADLTGELVPPDDGFGRPGNGQFNTPPLVEAADTPPFFHNNAVATIEGAVAFYDGDAFNNSPAGQVLAGATGGGIELDATQIEAVAAFLRVLNALENIRQSIELLEASGKARPSERVVSQVSHEIEDAIRVLAERALHLDAVALLREARASVERKPPQSRKAIELLREARSLLAEGIEG
jgi:mono/diheme cytochrome c family protein